MNFRWAMLIFISNMICHITIGKYLYGHKKQKKYKPIYNTHSEDDIHIFMRNQECLLQIFESKRKSVQVIKDNICNVQISEEEFLTNYHKKYSKLLIVTPGGINGFYMMGIIKYITERMNLDDYIFSGSSAGAWCCLFLCLKNHSKFYNFIPTILNELQKITHYQSLYHILYAMKSSILSETTTDDYQFDRLFIGVLRYENYKLTTTIYSNFTSLEDALDCCISSSHIPFITGDFSYIYQGRNVFDGAFSKYPFINVYAPTLIISPALWKRHTYDLIRNAMSISMKNINIPEMFWEGYRDSLINGTMLYDIME
jgi:hypothetical protein